MIISKSIYIIDTSRHIKVLPCLFSQFQKVVGFFLKSQNKQDLRDETGEIAHTIYDINKTKSLQCLLIRTSLTSIALVM